MEGIKVAVYDSDGNLLGYKADTSWNLTENRDYAKVQSPTAEKRVQLTRNLLHILNKGGLVCETDNRLMRERLIIVEESLEGVEIGRQEIYRMPDGEYALVA